MKVLIYVSDSLRPDFLSESLSPNVEKLKQGGVTFTNAFSQATWTASSAPSLLYSKYPEVMGTAIEELYSTKTGFLPSLAKTGTQINLISSMSMLERMEGYYPQPVNFVNLTDEYSTRDVDIATKTADAVIDALPEDQNSDFGIIAWTAATHTPYRVPDDGNKESEDDRDIEGDMESLQESGPGDTERVHDLYSDTVRYSDEQLGRILQALRERGHYEDTMVILTSDHGEILGEHGRFDLARGRKLLKTLIPSKINNKYKLFSGFGYVGHLSLPPYEELLRIPMIIKFPNDEFSHKQIAGKVEAIDIGPTICDYYNIDAEGIQGRSLLPAISERTDVTRSFVYSSSEVFRSGYRIHSVRDSRFKYIRFTNPGASIRFNKFRGDPDHAIQGTLFRYLLGKELLVDTKSNEEHNVIDQFPDKARNLRNEFKGWRKRNLSLLDNHDTRHNNQMLDEETREAMEDLGYL